MSGESQVIVIMCRRVGEIEKQGDSGGVGNVGGSTRALDMAMPSHLSCDQ